MYQRKAYISAIPAQVKESEHRGQINLPRNDDPRRLMDLRKERRTAKWSEMQERKQDIGALEDWRNRSISRNDGKAAGARGSEGAAVVNCKTGQQWSSDWEKMRQQDENELYNVELFNKKNKNLKDIKYLSAFLLIQRNVWDLIIFDSERKKHSKKFLFSPDLAWKAPCKYKRFMRNVIYKCKCVFHF